MGEPYPRNESYTVSQMECMERILEDFGVDGVDPNFRNTPTRFLKYLAHYFISYDAEDDLKTTFAPPNEDTDPYAHAMVVQTNIPYRAVCAHHLLPVLGTARIGYIPDKTVVGLSKLSRLVYGMSHKAPSLQEDVGNSVVDALMGHLAPLGAICVISAEHGCMAARGIEEARVNTITTSLRGAFITKHDARQEFYQMCSLP